jgi:hypothetical protein
MEKEYRDHDIGNAVLRVYSDGDVWVHPKPRRVKLHVDVYGYTIVHVYGFRAKLHRVMLTLFKRPPKPGEVGRHLDGNPANNTLSNLAWGTAVENWDDSRRHGTAQVGSKHGMAKLTEAQVAEIRATPRTQGSLRGLAKQYGVSKVLIGKIRSGEVWRHVPTPLGPSTRSNARKENSDAVPGDEEA